MVPAHRLFLADRMTICGIWFRLHTKIGYYFIYYKVQIVVEMREIYSPPIYHRDLHRRFLSRGRHQQIPSDRTLEVPWSIFEQSSWSSESTQPAYTGLLGTKGADNHIA